MGTSDSKYSKKDSSCLFSTEEIDKLDNIYSEMQTLESKVKIKGDKCSFSQLSSHVQPFIKDEHIVRHLHDTLCSMSDEVDQSSASFTIHGLRRYLAMLFRGTTTEKSLSASVLISKQNKMSHTEIAQFVCSIITSYFNILGNRQSAKHWSPPTSLDTRLLSTYLLKQLKSGHISSDLMYTETDLETWLTQTPLFNHLIDLVFHNCFNFTTFEENSHIPTEPLLPTIVKNKDGATTSLNQLSIVFLNFHIIPELQSSWRLLFDNGYHGNSFSQLVNRATKQGPVVIIVKDKSGHVFGGYSNVSLTEDAEFYGGYQCFLFSLAPQFAVFTPSGHNDNYVYLNHGAKTLPNGLGFGGQLEYFGLWVDESFSVGHSKGGPLCSTYDSPQLSGQPEFEIESVEVWGIGDKPDAVSQQTSILDADPGAKAILELVGKGGHSEGLREDDETAYIPGEHDLPLF